MTPEINPKPSESQIEIKPIDGPIDLTIQPPGSKSLTNRALLCAALASGTSRLQNVLDSEDTRVMIDCLRKLGVDVSDISPNSEVLIKGCGGKFPNSEADLFVENSGTTIRFLTAALGVHGGRFKLLGIDRMHQRPIGPLVKSLQKLGSNVKAISRNGCPPVVIDGPAADRNETEIAGDVSSQYLSGLMMATPLLNRETTVRLTGELVSKPYVTMTQELMRSFSVHSQLELTSRPIRFHITGEQAYRGTDYLVEPDASAASYFFGAAAICGGTATVTGLDRDSLQGDVAFVECLAKMGCEISYQSKQITVSGPAIRGIDIDMSDISDTVQTLAAVALFVDGPTTIRGVAHNRVKETDRIGDLITELRRLGAQAEELPDGLVITPSKLNPARIETYNDHRMAMSLSLVGLKQTGVVITNPECTAKTYPRYFTDLQKLYR